MAGTMERPCGYATVVPELRSILPRDLFTYAVSSEQEGAVVPGARVMVPFGERQVIGVVMSRVDTSEVEAKAILEVLDEPPPLLPHLVHLARWIAERYHAPLGETVKAMLPSGVRSARPKGRKRGPRTTSQATREAAEGGAPDTPLALSAAQREVVDRLLAALAERRHARVLLHGVTGSGKTEVYLATIAAALEMGRRALVLVPEISLTPQTIRRFAGRFPGRVALLHSGLTEAERAASWRRIREGGADVVVGSRSAVFAPIPDLGVVVVDEEDASAYKQDRVPRYHAVETALELGRLCAAVVVLGSATPRLETFFRAHGGDLEIGRLPERIAGRPLPPIEVVDLREELKAGNRSPISQSLERALEDTVSAGWQSILFLNRRGTATVVVCRSCGEALGCPNCSVSLVLHQGRNRCDCHYCGASRPPPVECPKCGSPAIRALGMGTERLEREVAGRFPTLRLLRMDRDTVLTRDTYFEIYDTFARGEADCLIGTQMVAKGWDLPGVRLVGVVNADTALHLPDYRSGELTFSLLTQVAGRAGRGDEPARVILQTYSPGHYAVRHAVGHDYLGFAREEIRIRRATGFPPYSRLCVCTVAHPEDAEAEARARKAVEKLSATLAPDSGVDVLGPTPAFLHRLRGEYRWQITLRGASLEGVLPHLPTERGWSIDVDPAL
ncbi:MAG TPA: primosomal protein N' [Candidatus Dormibacteraeota bacterium]|jgi:primosomal protein N' (replication factor Y)|nr:primosomal protein N' [Candidatus Dormibacteraeota bacterium]